MSLRLYDNKVVVNHPSIREELVVLFEECLDLSNCLKRKARQTHRDDPLSASGRILLQTLQLGGPRTVPALAHARSTSRQNIQVLTDKLAKAGLVKFVANPSHCRSDLVQLTPAGSAMLSSANEREADLLATLMPHTTEAEVNEAADLLRRLRLLMSGERRQRKRGHKAAHETQTTVQNPLAVPEEAGDELPINLL